MKRDLFLLVSCSVLLLPKSLPAAITLTTDHGPVPNFEATYFNSELSSTDLIQGLIATELAGDNGWHPANPAESNSLHPFGLPGFTDGAGPTGSGDDVLGLLNDFPELGTPTKLIQYDLASPSNIGQINVLTGNWDNTDGRIFSTFVIRYSTNGGADYVPLGGFVPTIGPNSSGYYQSDPSGRINEFGGEFVGNLETIGSFVSIFDDGGVNLANGVTNLQFDFYSVDNTQGENRDPFDGTNPFTGVDDGLTAAFVSPLVWEIDVIEGQAVSESADFDEDNDVDGGDFLAWQAGVGIDDGSALLSEGDANNDGDVDEVDLSIWRGQFGLGALATASLHQVPEPTSLVLVTVLVAAFAGGPHRGAARSVGENKR